MPCHARSGALASSNRAMYGASVPTWKYGDPANVHDGHAAFWQALRLAEVLHGRRRQRRVRNGAAREPDAYDALRFGAHPQRAVGVLEDRAHLRRDAYREAFVHPSAVLVPERGDTGRPAKPDTRRVDAREAVTANTRNVRSFGVLMGVATVPAISYRPVRTAAGAAPESHGPQPASPSRPSTGRRLRREPARLGAPRSIGVAGAR